MPLDKIDVLTQTVKSNFIAGYNAVAKPAPIEGAITIVPSGGRIENYPWLYPAAGLAQWKGYRRYAKLGETNYRVPNLVYDTALEVLIDDIEDDQTGGYGLKGAEMAKNAKLWPGIQCLQTLAAGQTTTCFDGTNFFASTHTIGGAPTGGNIITGTAAGTDGVTHAMACLFVNGTVKPLLWQNRSGPDFITDQGNDDQKLRRIVRMAAELRGAAAFGFWFDAVLVKWANTPTVAEVQTTLGAVDARFRQFTLPKNQVTDVSQYVHGQDDFNEETMMLVCSSKVSYIVRQAITLSLISQTENFFKGFGKVVTTGYMDAVV